MPILSMPQCVICGTQDSVYPCAHCGVLACKECTFDTPTHKCEHRLPVLSKSNIEWKQEDICE